MPLYYKPEEVIRMIQASLGAAVRHQRLKHVDDNGLLGDVERTDSGHRKYTIEQIERATIAIALLELGIGMRSVRALMSDPKIPILPDDITARNLAFTSKKVSDFDDAVLYSQDFAMEYQIGLELLKVKANAMMKAINYLMGRTNEITSTFNRVASGAKNMMEEQLNVLEKDTSPTEPSIRALKKRRKEMENLIQQSGKLRRMMSAIVQKLSDNPESGDYIEG